MAAADAFGRNTFSTYSYSVTEAQRRQDSKRLAECIQNALIAATGAANRGIKPGKFRVTVETNMPSVLAETGFIDNASERAKLLSDDYQNKLAQGFLNGIKNYFKV